MTKIRAFVVATTLVVASGFLAAAPASAHAGTHKYGPFHSYVESSTAHTLASIDRTAHVLQGYTCGSVHVSGSYWVFTCR